ncbi:MAG: hypothetical protein A2W90_10090 [Bacteroidetes bacterium GWF2_42_66]|nr:MAG: hypothetical protein A2W92_04910 [Bacteroidetes bacterium GWA2_42_15]OFX97489.1 MAG: hypothetical protein A2W89_01315 [Bacteroidetes bacterium GWE2_42_39]OFY43816.1 MAG: hypothetical protein A2W90_10090 [Bacteroidetes bacterium GWF2_42_66]HBL76200.1 hypothetical protein [Prolixibacteraceae bacterium]HCR90895.1 hypothetical protein [Prolixibacteraceae bacterium]
MEYEELQILWKTYDQKLDRLEKLNKKLILETCSKKSQKRINWLQYRNYYGLIMLPVILIVAMHPQFKASNVDTKFIIGAMLWLGLIVHSTWHFITMISQLRKVDLINDNVIESATKINDYKRMVIRGSKSLFITMPVALAGVLLIGWKGFHFDQNLMLFIIGLILVSFILRKRQLKGLTKRIDKLLTDIQELEEYKE